LPRKLGTTAAGEEITTNVGRFGPYVKYGAKYVSLKTDDPYEITPERALEVIREKEIADANRLILDFPDAGIQVLNGRYGPYITDKSRNAKIPKDKEPKSLTLEECQTLLAAAPVRTFGKWGRKNAKGANGKSKAAAAKTTANETAAPGAAKKRAAKGGNGAAAVTAEAQHVTTPSAASRPRSARPAARPGAAAAASSATRTAPTRMAAKDAKASADKQAPVKSTAAPKASPKAKKSSAKKKS
jgi:DNA topoisomerase-1